MPGIRGAQRVAKQREIYISAFGTLGNVEPKSAQTWLCTVRDSIDSGLGFGEGEPTHTYEALFTE